MEVPLARLTIGELLGRGSFGTVHAVQLDGTPLALKRISLIGTELQERGNLIAGAKREFRALRQLVHAHIVELHGVVLQEHDSIGLLLERAPHGSLRSQLRIPVSAVVGEHSEARVQLQVAAGIASGMAFLHSQTPPVLHHDLKSDNVLLFERADGQLFSKLTDFGLTHISHGSMTHGSHQEQGAAAGTIPFQAPEQFRGECSTASEVYSFAVILWEMLHGSRAWEGTFPASIIAAVSQGERLEVHAADSALLQLMMCCWRQSAADRPTFSTICSQLGRVTRTLATSSFKLQYEGLVERERENPLRHHELMASVSGLILEYAQRHGLSDRDARAYFDVVHANALRASVYGQQGAAAVDELLRELARLAVRMYSTAETLPANTPDGKELCSILNETLREDHPEHAIILTRVLNTYCVTGRQQGSSPVRWPPSNEVWRGGALPPQHVHFFAVGKKFRVPCFLSTSATRSTAERFMRERGSPDHVLWRIRFDDSRRCRHVNYIAVNDGSLGEPGADPNTAREDEYLFAPYSVFTVESITWVPGHRSAENGEDVPSHYLIVMRAAVDNQTEPEDLDTSPWA